MRLLKHPHKALKAKNELVSKDGIPGVSRLESEARGIMARHHGVGLAANQVGDGRRWFVWKFGGICINPSWEADEGSKRVTGKEGCLSWSNREQTFERVRESKIVAMWTDSKGEEQIKELTGLPAKVFQHECDHLEGRNIWDDV